MPNTAQYGSLKFDEAIDFFKNKINLPTETWSDITNEMHGRAFVVSGAVKAELLSDFHESILKSIDEGTDIAEFRKDFDKIVAKHGWSYKGKRGWRTSIILDTNLSTAYSAGREKQRKLPEIIAAFPNDEYNSMDDSRVRPLHKKWDGTILPHDDPWWSTHTPPNGWRCRCWKEPTSEGAQKESPNDGTTLWENPSTGIKESIPKGIDPGFAYNPLEASTMSDHATWQSIKKCPEQIQEAFLSEMAESGQYSGVLDKMINRMQSNIHEQWHLKGETKTVGWISPDIWTDIKKRTAEPYSPVITATDKGIQHTLRTKKNVLQKVTANELKKIPETIANPESVLWDTGDNSLLYVTSGENKKLKFVVKLERKSKQFKHDINELRTASKINVNNLKEKRYEVISGKL